MRYCRTCRKWLPSEILRRCALLKHDISWKSYREEKKSGFPALKMGRYGSELKNYVGR